MSRAEVVALARGWIGTPYRHRASLRGAGCDCLGLLRGVWCALYASAPATPPPYTPQWAETGGEEQLWRALALHLTPLPPGIPEPGDVLLFRLQAGALAKHAGIATNRDGVSCLIHAYSGRGVVESPLSAPWARRIVARFAFPDPKDIL